MTNSEEFYYRNLGNLYNINDRLAQNYINLQAKIESGYFDNEKFGPSKIIKDYKDKFQKIVAAIDNNKYTNVTKAQLNHLNKAWKLAEVTMKGRLEEFTNAANEINKVLGVDITPNSIKNYKYQMKSPEYLGLKTNIKYANSYAALVDSEQKLAAQKQASDAQLQALNSFTKSSEKQANFFSGFGKLLFAQAATQIANDIADSISHGYQFDQQISLMRKDYKAAYDASIKKRNTNAIKEIASDIVTYAAIGTAIMPGIGTAIGTAIGTITGGTKAASKWNEPNEELQKQAEQLYQANKYLPAEMKLQGDNRFYTDLTTAYGRNKEAGINDIRKWLKYSEEAYNDLTAEINEKTAIIEEFNTKKERGRNLTADELTQYAKATDELSQLTKKQQAEYGRKRSLESANYDYENYAFNKKMYNDSYAYQNAAIEYARNQTLGLRAGSQKDYIAGKFTSQDSLNSLLANSQTYTSQLKSQLDTIDAQIKSLEGNTDILSENKVKALQARRRQIQSDIYKEEDYQHGINDQLWQSNANIFNLNKSISKSSFSGRIANTLNNPFVQLNDIESLFAESLGKQVEIKRKIDEITGEDELSLTKKAKLIDEYNQMASQANQIKSARDQQYNQILAGVASSKYLTNNLGSFGRWAGTNDASATLTRLTSQQNSLLQKILDALLSEDRGMYYQ